MKPIELVFEYYLSVLAQVHTCTCIGEGIGRDRGRYIHVQAYKALRGGMKLYVKSSRKSQGHNPYCTCQVSDTGTCGLTFIKCILSKCSYLDTALTAIIRNDSVGRGTRLAILLFERSELDRN